MENYISKTRKSHNFLTPLELTSTIGEHNDVLDPYSALIDNQAIVGKNNVFYPNVVIERSGDGRLEIGDDNVFYPGIYVLASMGLVKIGNGNEFGPAGVTILANSQKSAVVIGDGGRYNRGACIMGETTLGDGSQVLGDITVQNCTLAGGGAYNEPDPDKRAAVLKGFGIARNVILQTGQVINGSGDFNDAGVQWQHEYHPKN